MAPDDEVTRRARGRLGTVVRERWHIDALLGVGGMAAVYAATHRNNGKRVALKMLHIELSNSTEIRRRFIDEGYAANRVAHAGAVSVLDDDVAEDGAAFLVMELLEGETLDARLRRVGRLPPLQVLSITDALLDVLAAAHTQGIVHRDIKPDNIFITTEGVVMLLDFGIARMVVEGRPRTTISGATMGTPAFMAPEQARGRWEDLDGRTDLWAVGATMFVQLTGRVVHEAETTNEELLAAMTRSAPALGDIAPELPRPVIEVVDRALAFEQRERWDDARCMQAAVRAAYAAIEQGDSAPVDTNAAPEPIHSTSPLAYVTPHQLVSNTDSNRDIHLPISRGRAGLWVAASLAVAAVAAVAISVQTHGRPTSRAVTESRALPQTEVAVDTREELRAPQGAEGQEAAFASSAASQPDVAPPTEARAAPRKDSASALPTAVPPRANAPRTVVVPRREVRTAAPVPTNFAPAAATQLAPVIGAKPAVPPPRLHTVPTDPLERRK